MGCARDGLEVELDADLAAGLGYPLISLSGVFQTAKLGRDGGFSIQPFSRDVGVELERPPAVSGAGSYGDELRFIVEFFGGI